MSLTTRLTVLFAGVLVLVLAGFSWLVFKETSTRFHELDQSLLLAKVQLVKDLAKESESEEELLGRLETSTRGHVGLYFSARNTYGAVFEQGDMQIPSELLKDLNVDNRRVKLRHDAHSLYAQRFEVLLQGDRRKPVSVVAAVDTKQHSQFLDSLAIKTRGYIGFSVLIGTLLGWMASRGGLSPLTTLRASAERLNVSERPTHGSRRSASAPVR
jgi:two-component system heavy metal sensor histidine kinase CusS